MENEDDLEPIFGGPDVVHNRWLNKNKGRYFVMLYGMYTNEHGIETYMHDCIPYAQYVLYKEKKLITKPWEEIYYINGNKKDDRIENLKIIDTRPQLIEVKYPYDPKKYYGRRYWNKLKRNYYVNLYLKKEYINDKSLEKQIRKPINIYIVETEKLKRFLNDDEKVIFIDGNKTNYSKKNLKIVKGIYSKYPTGEVPYKDYYIGKEKKHNNGSIYIDLLHKKDRSKRTTISRSKYRYELKLRRRLKDNERLVYKDGNFLNDDIDNLTYIKRKFESPPFEKFYISSIFIDKREGRKRIWLRHETNPEENLTMYYSRYRMQVLIGRFLSKDEEVDHIDNNKFNDSDNNLQILSVDEHRKKSAQEKEKMAPKITICCDECKNNFIKNLRFIRESLKYSKYNNFFCSHKCYSKNINNIKYKKLIKYICTSTGQEIEIPENARFLHSKFNPDALPFYDYLAVLKWFNKKERGSINANSFKTIE